MKRSAPSFESLQSVETFNSADLEDDRDEARATNYVPPPPDKDWEAVFPPPDKLIPLVSEADQTPGMRYIRGLVAEKKCC